MKRIVTLIGFLMISFSLTACNTMSGLGKDVERGGEKVQNAAEKSKQ